MKEMFEEGRKGRVSEKDEWRDTGVGGEKSEWVTTSINYQHGQINGR